MSLRINQNLFSKLVQRQLTKNNVELETAYERLSSGQRINKASDDPTGMAVSESLRYDIQGIRQNQQNVTSAFSMIGTAESQLGSLVDNLQRARELAVQAANDINSADNRASIQAELDQIVDEIKRITETSTYNELNLFDGTLSNRKIQVGTTASETILLNISDLRASTLGSFALVQSGASVGNSPITSSSVLINGVEIPPTTGDSTSFAAPDTSAIAKAKAINSVEAQTGVSARVVSTVFTAGSSTVSGFALDGVSNTLTINGASIGPATVASGDVSGTLVQAINSKSNQTGVSARIDDTGHLELTAADGRNITVSTTGTATSALGFGASPGSLTQTQTGQIELTSTEAFSLSGTPSQIGFSGAPPINVTPDSSTAVANLSVGDHDAAAAAIVSLDTAIAQIGTERASLGAIYNRLEALNDSLARKVEDLQTTDSRIRDADFALESARLTQSQILQDAALSVLAQANTTPQRAFELLAR